MNKNLIFGASVACILLFSAITYGIYINVSSGKHVVETTRLADVVRVVTVTRRDFEPVLRGTTRWEPIWTADIYGTTDGKIEGLLFKEGESVPAGGVIATIEGREVVAQLQQAQGNVVAAKAGYDQAASELRRASLLLEQNAISEQSVEAGRFRLEQANGQLGSAQGALEQIRYKADGLQVRAPRSGVIAKYYVSPGQFMRTGTAIASIADYTTLKMVLPMPDGEQTVWKNGDGVVVKFSGGEFRGTIVRSVDSKTVGPSQYSVEVAVENNGKILQIGMQAEFEIRHTVVNNVLTIPEQAIVIKDGKAIIYCVDTDNKVKIRAVILGYRGDGWCVIKGGLTEGEQVVVHGQTSLSEGMTLPSVKGAGQP